jgi:hypothetical protein
MATKAMVKPGDVASCGSPWCAAPDHRGSKEIYATCVADRLRRELDSLEQVRKRLQGEAKRIAADGTPEEVNAFAQRIIQVHRDVGEFERDVETTSAKSKKALGL